MIFTFLYQTILNNYTSSNPLLKAFATLLNWKRKTITRWYKPMIRLDIFPLIHGNTDNYGSSGNTPLLMPLSHDLPLNLVKHPLYSSNVGRIAAELKKKYPTLTAIDIGANIGDTIAMFRKFSFFPILCIEGNEKYFSLLKKNSAAFKKISIENAFVGEDDKSIRSSINIHAGSSYLNPTAENTSEIQIKPLPAILQRHEDFRKAKMLKIDTDGYDNLIIRGCSSYLKESKPVIFFEYVPYLLALNGDDGLSVFPFLKSHGYKYILVYDNYGDLMFSCEVDNEKILKETHVYFSGRRGMLYCDICAFHEEDNDVFESARNSEMELLGRERAKA